MPIPILQYGVKVRDPTTQQFSDLAALRGGQGPTGPGVPAGGTDGDVLVKNGAADYAGTWTNTPKLMGNLAYINTGSTADRLYQPGEYLVYNGQLYKVGSTAISQGQTLTPGGNIEAVQNGGFNDLITTYTAGALSTSLTGWTIVRSHLYKVGRIAILNMVVTRGTNAANDGALFNLPAGYIPIDTFEGRENDLDHASYCNYQVSSTGAFTVQAGPANTAIGVRIDMTYITK